VGGFIFGAGCLSVLLALLTDYSGVFLLTSALCLLPACAFPAKTHLCVYDRVNGDAPHWIPGFVFFCSNGLILLAPDYPRGNSFWHLLLTQFFKTIPKSQKEPPLWMAWSRFGNHVNIVLPSSALPQLTLAVL